jgi:deoxycytidylate deaminase
VSHEYFIAIAKTVAMRSKDTSSKVGCVIVAQDNTIVSTGYNGFVAGCDEDDMSWDRPRKYGVVIHAELNALIFAKRDLKGCIVYTTHGPCENCLKHLLQAKVREIYYEDPSIMRDRGTPDQLWAIAALINSTGARVKNVNGKNYLEELWAMTKLS